MQYEVKDLRINSAKGISMELALSLAFWYSVLLTRTVNCLSFDFNSDSSVTSFEFKGFNVDRLFSFH